MRCFVALDLPEPVRNHLAGLGAQFAGKGQVKWVPADQLHVTLLFAGDLPDEAAPALGRLLHEVALPALSLSLASLDHFPPRGEPRVIWAKLGGDVDALTALQAELAARAEPLGVPRDKRPFVPHVTLGRVKSPFGALALIDRVREVSKTLRDKPFATTALSLYASELWPEGPRHRQLERRLMPDRG